MIALILKWFSGLFVKRSAIAYPCKLSSPIIGTEKPLVDIELKYEHFYNVMQLKPNYSNAYNDALKRITKAQERYMLAETITKIPWQVIAVLHYRESHCDFSRQLLNGQKWNRKTTLVPAELGPWTSWEASCETAFIHAPFSNSKYIGRWLDNLEAYNGLGYRNRGYISPYVFAGTGFYNGGLYVADGKFDETKNDNRVGVAILLKGLGFETGLSK